MILTIFRCAYPDDDPAKFGKDFLKNHPEIDDATLAPVVLLPGTNVRLDSKF
jgi:hypothetical protein